MNSESIFSDNSMGKYRSITYISTEFYNRVDKVNMNNIKIVSPEKKGKDHFALADEINQPRSRQIDDHHIE